MAKLIQHGQIGTWKREPPREWQPGANTIAYYKFVNDINDYSGNNNNLTGSGNFNNNMITSTSRIYYDGNSLFGQDYSGELTVMARIDYSNTASDASIYFISDISSRPCLKTSTPDAGGWDIFKGYSQSGYGRITTPDSWKHSGATDIHHTALVRIGNIFYCYWDGVQQTDTVTMTGYIGSGSTPNERGPQFGVSGQGSFKTITLGEVIMENKGWSPEDIAKYVNYAKSKYGL